MAEEKSSTPEERARRRAKSFVDLMWHVVTFVIVNGFMWGIDLAKGGGVNWAFWLTITWGIGLAFHVAAYVLGDGGLQERKYRRFLADEKK